MNNINRGQPGHPARRTLKLTAAMRPPHEVTKRKPHKSHEPPICTPSQQGQSAFRTARERTLCGFASVAEITRSAPTWLAGDRRDAGLVSLGSRLWAGGGFPLQAAGGMCHRAVLLLVFAVVFDRNGARGS